MTPGRIGLDPEAIEAVLREIELRLAAVETIAHRIDAEVAAASAPLERPASGPGVLAPWSVASARAALAGLRAGAANARWLLALVRAHVDDQIAVSAITDRSPVAVVGAGRSRSAEALRRFIAGDPGPLLGVGAHDRAAAIATLGAARLRVLAEQQPHIVGGLDGMPAWARDVANRRRLEVVRADPTVTPTQRRAAEQVASTLRDLESRREGSTHLVLLDLPVGGENDMRAAIAQGDLDTAAHVAILVPGMHATVESIGTLAAGAANLRSEMGLVAPGSESAVLAWVGYETPGLGSVVSDELAVRGGIDLATLLAGIRAATPEATLTVVAHSYGTRVATSALSSRAPGVDADGLVLIASPGVAEGVRSVDQLDVTSHEVYAMRADADRVAPLGHALSQPGGDRVAAVAFGSLGALLLGPLGAAAASAGVDAMLADPGEPNADPMTELAGARVLDIEGGGARRAVRGHAQLTSDHAGYLDRGTDALRDVALVSVGRGSRAR